MLCGRGDEWRGHTRRRRRRRRRRRKPRLSERRFTTTPRTHERERESGGCRQTEGQTDAKAAARECDAPDILALKGTERRRDGRRRRERADRKAPKKERIEKEER